MKNLTEIITFLEDVLGKTAAEAFDENLEELTYFVRSEALNNLEITEPKMRGRLKRLSEGILLASIKRYLNDNYADDYGDVEVNVGRNEGVYDRNMQPISAIEKIRKFQREIISIIVARCMIEFSKGRELAKILEDRCMDKNEPTPKDINWSAKVEMRPVMLEQVEIEIMRLERRLPNINPEEAAQLSQLYSKLRIARHK